MMTGDSGLLRLLNAQLIVEVVFREAPEAVSRAEIARATGLSKPTVSGLVAELEDAGVLRPVGADRSGAVGRPATPYEVVPEGGFALAADIGATKIVVGIADLLGVVRAERQIETGADAEKALAQVVSIAAELQADLDCEISTACVGVPGIYRRDKDVVDQALNLPGFSGLRVGALLTEAFGIDVHVDNDVNLAALGEVASLAPDDARGRDFVAVSIGTGIGAGLVLGGELYRGGSDAAGEIGSLVVASEPSGDGSVSTLEDVASAAGFEKTFRESLEAGFATSLGGSPSVREIMAAAASGDPAAARTLDIAGTAMALAVSHLSLVVNPNRVIFGGGVGANPTFVDAVGAALERFTSEPLELAASTLGRRAAFVGATNHAVESLQGSLVQKRLGLGG